MAIHGTSHWNDRNKAYYQQSNNPTEHMLKVRLPHGISWLETCGPTAAINCIASMGNPVEIYTPGGYLPQPEEVLSDWFNDPQNFERMKHIWSVLSPEEVAGNEVLDWYPLALRQVFDVAAHLVSDLTAQDAVAHLCSGGALQICLKSPGHYLALVAYDDITNEFIYHDSWAERWPEGDGFCRRMTMNEFATNRRPKALVYW